MFGTNWEIILGITINNRYIKNIIQFTNKETFLANVIDHNISTSSFPVLHNKNINFVDIYDTLS